MPCGNRPRLRDATWKDRNCAVPHRLQNSDAGSPAALRVLGQSALDLEGTACPPGYCHGREDRADAIKTCFDRLAAQGVLCVNASWTYRRIDPRIARLAIHAASTVALFLIETWERKMQRSLPAEPVK